MSLLDDNIGEISDTKIAIWDIKRNIKPTPLYNIPIYSSLPEIDNNMYNGQIIFCSGDIFVLSDKSWVKIGTNV